MSDTIKEKYFVDFIDKKVATDIVIKNHYLHRKPPCSLSFGLFKKEDGEVLGVATYGIPPSHTLLKGICGEYEMRNVYELNRVWVSDIVPKNGESFFISKTLKMLDREIVVSFADTSQEHVGYIYQALNFFYCGLSAKFLDPKVVGLENQHHATYANRMNKAQLVEKYGDRLYYSERPRKHRYIYFNAKGKRRKELMEKLRYKIMPYPKKEGVIK